MRRQQGAGFRQWGGGRGGRGGSGWCGGGWVQCWCSSRRRTRGRREALAEAVALVVVRLALQRTEAEVGAVEADDGAGEDGALGTRGGRGRQRRWLESGVGPQMHANSTAHVQCRCACLPATQARPAAAVVHTGTGGVCVGGGPRGGEHSTWRESGARLMTVNVTQRSSVMVMRAMLREQLPAPAGLNQWYMKPGGRVRRRGEGGRGRGRGKGGQGEGWRRAQGGGGGGGDWGWPLVHAAGHCIGWQPGRACAHGAPARLLPAAWPYGCDCMRGHGTWRTWWRYGQPQEGSTYDKRSCRFPLPGKRDMRRASQGQPPCRMLAALLPTHLPA